MSAGARVIDPSHSFARTSEPATINGIHPAPGLVGIPHARPFANPLMQHCPGAISAPQLLQPKTVPAPLDESSRDGSETGSGTHVLAGSDDAGVEQKHPSRQLEDAWPKHSDVDDITCMLLPEGTMMDGTGGLDDFLGLGSTHGGAAMDDELRNGELVFEFEPFAGPSKILVGVDDEGPIGMHDHMHADDEPLLVPSSPSSRQDSCHPVPSVDWGLLTPSGASLVSMANTAMLGKDAGAGAAAARASKLGGQEAAAGVHTRTGSTSSPAPATTAASAPPAAVSTPVFSSSSKFGGPCMHCGATESPQWRRGPPEKPMLCNACGTRYRRSNQLGPVPGPAAQKAGVQKKKPAAVGGQLTRWSSGSRGVRKA